MDPVSSDKGLSVHKRKTSFFHRSLLIGSHHGVTECTEEDVCVKELSRERKDRNVSHSKMEVLHFSSCEKPMRSQ